MQIQFWQPDTPSVTGMFRIEREERLRTTYAERFAVVVVQAGAFDGWYRGAVRTHVAGAVKLKDPGEVHRNVRIHAPVTLQGAIFSHATIAEAAATLGVRGPVHFRAAGFGPGERAAQLATAMHAALVQPGASELAREALIAETLAELLGPASDTRASRAVRRARAYLDDAVADKVTLDELAAYAGLDKFHLVRAFRAEVGVPPYEYLTQARIGRAKELLQRGTRVVDVAHAVGFCDESQLHRHFRRILGIAPGRFARSFGQHRPSGERAAGTVSRHDR